MDRSAAEFKLKQIFGFEQFYDHQWEAIDKLLSGRRIIMIEKTGFGKSLCYQFPALMFDGITIIFSPLIALMRDQVKKLQLLGIAAKCINSEQTDEENSQIISEALANKLKILYIAPERQENYEWIEATRSLRISMVVVDEAHCISVWGHDFRPSFRRIINLIKLLPLTIPVLATTATATLRVQNDISDQIGGNNVVIRGKLLRENLKLYVVKVGSEDEKLLFLSQILPSLEGSGILYTGTRVNTEIYARWSEYCGISSVAYNAGMDGTTRVDIESGFISDRWKCVISTNALGMGIDKPDIRFIIHTQIPQSPVHYYQEIGRAGRDGKEAVILLFYSPEDVSLPMSFIESARPSAEKFEKVINALKSDLLGERELMIKTNLTQTQIRVIKAELMDQKIIREITIGGKKKLEYIYNAPAFSLKRFEQLRSLKLAELDKMIEYVNTEKSRMKFLCEFLDDPSGGEFNNCDNTGLTPMQPFFTGDLRDKLSKFKAGFFPVLQSEARGTKLLNGVAAGFYGFSNIGAVIHRCKYETHEDYPEHLITLAAAAFKKHFEGEKPDVMLYVPSTKSGDLVKNYAYKLSLALKIPVSDDLIKIRTTEEQKKFINSYLKKENLSGAFALKASARLSDKTVLLADDVYDSGATIKEIGSLLTKCGVAKILPLVIAKTVGGDSV